jgi:IS4 transposase
VLVDAGTHVGHPKLMMQVDAVEVERAYRTLRQHLKTVDVKDRRKGAVLSLLGSLSFNLLAVLALLLLVLVWRGFL